MLYVLWGICMQGCAIRSSVILVEAEQQYFLAQPHKEIALYEWNMADQYIKKAREEYATSNLYDAEYLAKEAQKWAVEVQKKAQNKKEE